MKKIILIAGLLMVVGIANAEPSELGDDPGPLPAGMTTPGNSCSYKFMVTALKSPENAPKGTNAVTIVGKNEKGQIQFSSSVCYGKTSKMYTNRPCKLTINATYVDYPGEQCNNNTKGTGPELASSALDQAFQPAETYNLTFTPGSGWIS